MRILAVESSCDDLSWAVVEDGKHVLACHVASQIDIHAKTGGVVPEVAAREHLTAVLPVLDTVLEQVPLASIDAIACTAGPGLLGSLLVGISAAQTLSVVTGKPLIPVHHIEGHVAANWLERDAAEIVFPALVLTVSGGHNDLYLMHGFGSYDHIGTTKDDAAGEAFDKVARMLGLGYPGGPAIEKCIQECTTGDEIAPLPRAWGKKGEYDWSFSGLKSEVRRRVMEYPEGMTNSQTAGLAREFVSSVVDVLCTKALDAYKQYQAKTLMVTGGVSASTPLRDHMLAMAEKRGIHKESILFPVKKMYSTDNAAMIACAAYHCAASDPTRLLEREVDKLAIAPMSSYVLSSSAKGRA